jgi:secreted trypsin-like serine protease
MKMLKMPRMKKTILFALGALCVSTTHGQPANVTASPKSLLQQAVDRFKSKAGGDRIIGGELAEWSANPWQVALVYAHDKDNMRAQFCGGSILSPAWVVTAAHCIDVNYDATNYEVLSGTDDLKSKKPRSRVLGYIVHPKWRLPGNKNRYDHDVALLRIDPSTPLTGKPIRLAPPTTKLEDLAVLVTGWGHTEYRPEGSPKLQKVVIPSVSKSTCNAQEAYDGTVTEWMFCAGEYKKDSCQGDSGGPASALVNDRRLLIGIVSWGIGCGERDKYGVYTRLPVYSEWVKDETGGQIKY